MVPCLKGVAAAAARNRNDDVHDFKTIRAVKSGEEITINYGNVVPRTKGPRVGGGPVGSLRRGQIIARAQKRASGGTFAR